MARPRSDERRNAIIAAATRVVASVGLGAPTASIAAEAGISNGSLFTYFETKADLFNQLYVELKSEMASVVMGGLPDDATVREQLHHVWTHWLYWSVTYPEKRRALALLGASGDIAPASRQSANQGLSGVAMLVERSRESGPMRNAPLGLVVALMAALAEATIDFMASDPANAASHGSQGFEALWRIVA